MQSYSFKNYTPPDTRAIATLAVLLWSVDRLINESSDNRSTDHAGGELPVRPIGDRGDRALRGPCAGALRRVTSLSGMPRPGENGRHDQDFDGGDGGVVAVRDFCGVLRVQGVQAGGGVGARGIVHVLCPTVL